MKCADCGEEILQKDPWKCPYCGSANLISNKDAVSNSIAEIEKLEKAGRYEAAALRYEKLEMLDKAKECRRRAKTSHAISAKIKTGKVSTISIECPYCGASQPLSSKNNKVKCKHCEKKYLIPKKVLRLL
jgi:DNA-directed RNA polymerase subunit RPC12/RpoP/ribosomal protein S27AE